MNSFIFCRYVAGICYLVSAFRTRSLSDYLLRPNLRTEIPYLSISRFLTLSSPATSYYPRLTSSCRKTTTDHPCKTGNPTEDLRTVKIVCRTDREIHRTRKSTSEMWCTKYLQVRTYISCCRTDPSRHDRTSTSRSTKLQFLKTSNSIKLVRTDHLFCRIFNLIHPFYPTSNPMSLF